MSLCKTGTVYHISSLFLRGICTYYNIVCLYGLCTVGFGFFLSFLKDIIQKAHVFNLSTPVPPPLGKVHNHDGIDHKWRDGGVRVTNINPASQTIPSVSVHWSVHIK